jgi:predicted ATP-dependent protease
MSPVAALPLADLAWICDPGQFTFASTAELPEIEAVIGQERAVEALRFALAMRRPGYNVYALGPEGIGRHTTVRRLLDARAATEPPPADWCYVENLAEPRRPRVLRLEAGRGSRLQADMGQLVNDLGAALRNAFENEEYRTRRQVIEEELKERQEQVVGEVEAAARQQGIALIRSPMGLAMAPVAEGKVLGPEQFQALPEPERKRIETDVEALQKQLRDGLANIPAWMKEGRERLKQLNDGTASLAVGYLIDALKQSWADHEPVQDFLEEVRWDVIRHVELLLGTPQPAAPTGPIAEEGHPVLRRYRVNLLVDNAGAASAPVIHEDDPSFDRLVGRAEYRAEMGTLVTDVQMIRAGALHRANGGYLVLDARKLLSRPMAYEALKRALLTGEIRIESPMQSMGLMATASLEPEPVALDVKVVLVGERQFYYMLAQNDPDFAPLFKVAADFDERQPRDPETLAAFARMIATLARREDLRPFAPDGVARALEEAAREVDNREKLSGDLEALGDLLREADYWAGERGQALVGAAEVEAAVAAQERRHERVPGLIQESMVDGTLKVETAGAVVGQVNGLSVYFMGGGLTFGRPMRITARARMGGPQVMDIEREIKLGGALHSKGVLIMIGYLNSRYAGDVPAALQATLVFEQSYGGIDGDSASSAELYALLSAIGAVPIRQSYAVTGSISQKGEVQAIGGVNQKIEGFFDLCAARGLDGSHGVLIPRANVAQLQLRRRVRDAVAAGLFNIFPVSSIDQGIELLTGMPAGVRDPDGKFPEGTVNWRVEDRLRRFAHQRRAFGNGKGERRRPPPIAGEPKPDDTPLPPEPAGPPDPEPPAPETPIDRGGEEGRR